ncbi:MAG: hypothetical protein IPI55_02265 [Flavobacteriales bacterium]|nr:hypothetical protein [Flavobacteriales bacterium]
MKHSVHLPQRPFALLAAALACSLLLAPVARAQETISIDGKPCGPHGNAKEGTKEWDQNPLKNRYKFPSEVTVLDFNDPIDGSATKEKFSSATAVELVGYVESITWGSRETCNCKTGKSLFQDTHMEITPNSSQTGPQYRVTIEVTPRIRQIMDRDYGEDWTSSTLKKQYLHRMVRIQGWLFYDNSHENWDYANDPDDVKGDNRRATSWEIHPVTYMELMDEEFADGDGDGGDDDDGIGTSGSVTYPPSPTHHYPNNTNTMNTAEHTPAEWLDIILLAMILGIVGQLIRAVVGLSKASAKVAAGDAGAGFRPAELLFSLLIAMVVGAVAGVLAAVTAGEWQGGEMITAFIAAGYAGTDFIEGWMKKGGTGTTTTVPATSTPGAPAAGAVPPNAPLRPAPPVEPSDV